MSIASEISRLLQAKADIKIAIEGKGVTVSGSATLDDYSDLIDAIQQGSEPNLQSKSVSITENGTTTVEPDTGYDGLSDVNVSVNVQGGGGASSGDDVRFLDYDGTILHSYSASDFLALTEMPENPSHEGLTAQGWNWTLADAKEQVQEMGSCDIGQNYITDDGKTRLYIELVEGRLSPYLGIGVKGTAEIDWGDGSAKEILTGQSQSVAIYRQHNYSEAGDYCITIEPSKGINDRIGILGTSNNTCILRKDSTDASYIHGVYSNAIKRIELGSNIVFGLYGLKNCYSLSTITIPKGIACGDYAFDFCESLKGVVIGDGVNSIGACAFRNCASFLFVSIPKSVKTIGNNAFNNCYPIKSLVLPFGVTSCGNVCFGGCSSLGSFVIPSGLQGSLNATILANCHALKEVTIPTGITSLSNSVLNGCYSLANITIPESVTSIGNYAFSSCYGVAEYHFKSTTPPTLGGTSVFNSIPSDCKIYVPAESLSAYKSADKWSTHASKMVGE